MKDLFSPQQHLKWSGVVFAVIVAIATSAYLPATAQEEGIIALGEWSYKDLESGWTAEEIMDADVIGDDGEEIGSLENLLLTEEGKVVAIVAEIGGFWNIGVTHVAVPWNETEWEDGGLILPVTEDNVEDYSLFDEYFSRYDVGEITTVDDDLATGPDIWKVTSLLDDYALLENNVGYGLTISFSMTTGNWSSW